MQNIYVLDDESILTIEDVINVIKVLQELFNNQSNRCFYNDVIKIRSKVERKWIIN